MSKRERIEALGQLLEKLTTLMDMDVFEILSKNHTWWYEVSEKDLICEFTDDPITREDVLINRLDDCRMKFAMIHDVISECWTIARGDDEE